jgi:Na+-transporting methylmalonyl-CoA/oxaloacetate decarboxylase beta subunit
MNINTLVHLFHLIIVGGLFLYVGIIREKIPKIMFPILFGLGIIIVFYHIYKTYNYIKEGKGFWVNLIHIFIIGPLLIFIGYYGEKTSRLYFELLLMIGFAAIGYHGYYLVKN